MSDVGQVERMAQDRVVALFRDSLGYEHLGNWEYRAGNSNVEVELLTQNLRARGYSDTLINEATLRERLRRFGEEFTKLLYGLLTPEVEITFGR